ncbi:MAG TPA: glycerophosphodiester phosphodiesterase family protein [Saprospiraceae bacterium]|nr:glycerophosphodiester phosphodiesterase family protein [Saprospiraceae bacterium]
MKNHLLHLIWGAALFLLAACTPRPANMPAMNHPTAFDWQGHRGARGLAPENTVPSFLKALEFPLVSTLELDVVISKDRQVIVSHEPWMSHEICSHAGGKAVQKSEEETLIILQLTAAEIAAFDCGSRGHTRFPEQEAMQAAKPTLEQVVQAVAEYCAAHNRPLPQYNIEIKSQPAWDEVKTPAPALFARLVVDEIRRLSIAGHTCVQSFDPRSLREVHRLAPDMVTALLVENVRGLEQNVKELGYVPTIYSPYFKLVNAETVKNAHAQKMRIIPWTVNETADMQALIRLGVDGIITDYPNRIPGN